MFTVVSFVVILLILVFVHELGHFLAAKLLGVRVERFSLGFPPKLWSKTIGETDYQLAWLPLGGYVKMYGDDPEAGETVPPELRARSFSHQPAWAKMVIVLAGPVFNLIFAAVLFWGLIWASGVLHLAPTVGPVTPGGPAERAGLRLDDTLVEVDGRPVEYFDQLESALAEGRGAPLTLTVRREGAEHSVTLTPTRVETKDLFGDTQVYYDPGFSHRMKPVIAKLVPGQAAEAAGLESGDVIVAIGGRPTPDWQDVLLAIQGPPEERAPTTPQAVRPLVFEVERGGQSLSLEVTPQLIPGFNTDGDTTFTPMVGMESRPEVLSEGVGLLAAARMGVEEAGRMIGLTLLSVRKLITGEVSAKTLGGPILIAEVAGDRARAGLTPFLNLAAFISINLGILNLLPIPMLDGGQLLFFILEAIRRKPLSTRFREVTQWVGAALLGLLMVTVFYNDIARLVTRLRTKTEVQTIEAIAPTPPPAPAAEGPTP